jgi:von Willebrand factor
MNPVFDESRLTAYALGELNDTDRAAVERELNEHPELHSEVEQIRALAASLTTELARELAREPALSLDEVRRAVIREAAREPVPVKWPRLPRYVPWFSAAAVNLLAVLLVIHYWPTVDDAEGGAAVGVSVLPIAPQPELSPLRGEAETDVSAHDVSPNPGIPLPAGHSFAAVNDVETIELAAEDPIPSPLVMVPSPKPATRGPVEKRWSKAFQDKLALGDKDSFGDGTHLGIDADGDSAPPAGVISPSLDDFPERTDQPFLRVGDHPLSTFSVDVDTASYSVVPRVNCRPGTRCGWRR